MTYPKFILLPAVAAMALSLSACNPNADTTTSKSSPGDPMRSAQGPGAPSSPGGTRSDPATSPAAPGSGSSPSDPMSKEEKDRETSPAPSGLTK